MDGISKANLFLSRVCNDWDRNPPGMRKALTSKDATPLHQSCALFLHFSRLLERSLPSGEVSASKEKLTCQFFLGGMDAELNLCAEQSVPPGDMRSIGSFRSGLVLNLSICLKLNVFGAFLFSAFRTIITAHETRQNMAKEEKAQELAQKVVLATLEQLKGQVADDMVLIRAALPSKEDQTMETAKDMKFVKDRQMNLIRINLFKIEIP